MFRASACIGREALLPEAINRVHNLAADIAEQNALMREVAAKSAEALRLPRPDTFLSRKTHEPFPEEPKE
ncbi:hypothetical protein [uncultured Bradyrhizobium sp.]|jgi:hypothetical protein|uniref:hypothetical protein n=1 Tax=uncultured Bradyrhizobium sp. TaxID=199684 RepID=UPI00260BE9C8|nr:hypothetical protein [uncultured Bradyrhizobium sp.]